MGDSNDLHYGDEAINRRSCMTIQSPEAYLNRWTMPKGSGGTHSTTNSG